MQYVIPAMEIKKPKNLRDYIGIPGTRLVIGREQSHGNNNFDQMDSVLKSEGHFMPSPAIFNPYRNEVLRAAAGDITLYDGSGKRISRNDSKQLAQKLTGDCWVYLYARFSGENGKNITYNRIRNAGTIEEVTESLQLPEGIHNEDLVDLAWSKQGMPIRKSRKQEFDPQKNLFFYNPVDGSVAGLGADAGGADLGCGRDPRGSSAALGVFACAAGAQNF